MSCGVSQGAQFNMADYDGRTALHIACCEGHVNVVKYLLDLGAPVHMRDRYGDTPLDDAVTFHRATVIGMLRMTGAHLTMPPSKLAVAVNKLVVQGFVKFQRGEGGGSAEGRRSSGEGYLGRGQRAPSSPPVGSLGEREFSGIVNQHSVKCLSAMAK